MTGDRRRAPMIMAFAGSTRRGKGGELAVCTEAGAHTLPCEALIEGSPGD